MIELDWVGPVELSSVEVGRVPRGIPGIYMLHVFDRNRDGFPVFYVGKASDIRRRLLQHMTIRSTKPIISAMREFNACYWSAAPVESQTLLTAIESGLIRMLRPTCNKQTPTCMPLLPILPPLKTSNVLKEAIS